MKSSEKSLSQLPLLLLEEHPQTTLLEALLPQHLEFFIWRQTRLEDCALWPWPEASVLCLFQAGPLETAETSYWKQIQADPDLSGKAWVVILESESDERLPSFLEQGALEVLTLDSGPAIVMARLRAAVRKAQSQAKALAQKCLAEVPLPQNRTPIEQESPPHQLHFYKALMEASGDAIFVVNPDISIRYVSPACEKIFGIPIAEWYANPLLVAELLDPAELPRFQSFIDYQHRYGVFPEETVEWKWHLRGERVLYTEQQHTNFFDLKGQFAGMLILIRDVTERKLQEQWLQESYRRYRLVLDIAIDGFWMADMQGQILEVNEAYCQMSGYSREELLQLSIHHLDVLDSAEQVKMRIQRMSQLGYARFVSKHRHKNGRVYDVEVSAGNIPELQICFAFLRDISQAKQIQEELLHKKALLRAAIEGSLDAVYFLKAILQDDCHVSDFEFVDLNHKAEAQMRTSKAQILGQKLCELYPVNRTGGFFEKYIQVYQTGIVLEQEYQIASPDAATGWYYQQVVPLADGIVIFNRDIGARKCTELALYQSEQRWQFALEGSGAGVWDWNLLTGKVFFSKRWKAMIGYEDEEIGNDLSEWDKRVHPEDKASVYEVLGAYLQKQTEIYESEHRVLCKDGSYKWILDRGKIMEYSPEGKPLRMVGTHSDIDERKRYERLLRQERDLFMAGPVVVFRWKAAEGWPIEYVSPNISQWGYFAANLMEQGQIFSAFVHPEDAKQVEEEVKRYTTQGLTFFSQEYRLQDAFGRFHWVSDFTTVIYDENRQVVQYHGYLLDVTHRHEIEETLREKQQLLETQQAELLRSEQKLRSILNTVLDPIISINQQGLIETFNYAAEVVFGYQAAEVLGKNVKMLMPEPYASEHDGHLLRYVDTGHSRILGITRELEAQRKDGSTFPIYLAVNSSYYDGKLHFTGLIRDITHERIARLALLESERRYRSLIEYLPDAIFVERQGLILFTNAQGAEICGETSPENLVGQVLENYLTQMIPLPLDDPHYLSPLYETRLKNSKQEWRDVEVYVRPYLYLDQSSRMWVVRDVSIRKQIEAQWRQAQKMEAIGTLAGGVAHDFNNMLFAMIGYITLARDSLSSGHASRRDLEEALRAASRAKELVRQILTFSRQHENSKQVFEVQHILKESLQLLRPSLSAQITIRTRIHAEGRIFGDPTQIHQVIINLCTNAAQAMRERGGILTLSLDQATAEDAPPSLRLLPGQYVRLTVEDTGTGMSQDVQERIFEPFFTTKKVGEGTGLGLAVVHGIVLNHQGAIEVKSQPELGTQFRIWFPYYAIPQAEPILMESKPLQGKGRLVLVDDEEALVEIFERFLGSNGYQVRAFHKSEEAQLWMLRHPQEFDVLVTDQTMPQLTGLNLIDSIIALRPELPIVLMTGYNPEVEELDTVRIPNLHVLLKPFTPEIMLITLNGMLGSKST